MLPEMVRSALAWSMVTPSPWPPAPRRVEFSIRDNGPGIAEELKSQIFDPGSVKTPRSRAAHGLGLPYSAYVVFNHDGQLRETGEAGKGANFVIF